MAYRFFIILLLFSNFTVEAQQKNSIDAYCLMLPNIIKCTKNRHYSKALQILEDWQKLYSDSPIHPQTLKKKSQIELTINIFKALDNCEFTEKLLLPLDGTKVEALNIRGGVLSYKKTFRGGGKGKKSRPVIKLPISTIYFLLKRTRPKSYLSDSTTISLLDHNFKMTNKFLKKIRKGEMNKQELVSMLQSQRSLSKVKKEYKIIRSTRKALKAGDFSKAKSLLKKSVKYISQKKNNPFLLTDTINVLNLQITQALNEKEQNRLKRYINYPVANDQRTKVSCLEFPKIKYDVYLPPQYDRTGKKVLPILYTFSYGGGGMVHIFKDLAKEMGIILIGNLESKNNQSMDQTAGSWYAMVRDVQRRIHFDPARQFAGGMSGGGMTSYKFSRCYSSSISGLIPMGAWLGKLWDKKTQWYSKGLVVARTTGNNDKNAKAWLDRDKEHLEHFSVTVNDWQFPGGHVTAPKDIQNKVFKWLLSQRPPAKNKEKKAAHKFYKKCQLKVSQGKSAQVFVSCMNTLFEQPYTWHSLKAQIIIDKILKSHSKELKKSASVLKALNARFKVQDTIDYYLYSSALIGDAKTFNSLLSVSRKMKRLNPWSIDTLWLLATSEFKGIKNPKRVLSILKKEQNLSTNEMIGLAAAHSKLGNNSKCKELMEKINSLIQRKKTYDHNKYKKLQEML